MGPIRRLASAETPVALLIDEQVAEAGARLGIDADVFPFPALRQPGPMVVAGGDALQLVSSAL